MVQALCRHVSDDSPTVRRLCLRGLVQMSSIHVLQYTTQILGVILALIDDSDESVLESSSRDAVEPVLLNLSIRLLNLQMSDTHILYCASVATYVALALQKCRRVYIGSSKSSTFGGYDTGCINIFGAFKQHRLPQLESEF
ncbi:hypothetical protein KY289_033164 [Solanum tuberosum]|nr:hypothetical protein KY289_033164 [Solanum tuberosum]